MNELLDDIRQRLYRMPVYSGTGTTIPALPAAETVATGTLVYPHPWWFMQAVIHPEYPVEVYTVPAPPLRPLA